MTRSEELVANLVSDPVGSESDGRATQLLEEYYRGAPVGSLRSLMQSQDERLEGEAAWIGSELPNAGRGLLDGMTKLLNSRSRKARFFAVDCIQSWSVPALDGSALSKALSLVNDDDRAVRWKVLCFLATADREQLEAAATFLSWHEPSSAYLPSLNWLLSPNATTSQAIQRIGSDDLYERRLAAVAAARLKDRGALMIAARSLDEEVAQFAKDMLERLSVESSGPAG